MFRIADILKNKMNVPDASTPAKPTEEQKPPKEEPAKSESSVSPIQIAKTITQKGTERLPRYEMHISKAMKEIEPDMERSKGIYLRCIQLAEELLKNTDERKSVEIKPIRDLLDEVINCFVLGDKILLTICYEKYEDSKYVFNHLTNVMIMSIAIGLKLGYNQSRLNELGLLAFLHDVGVIKATEISLGSQVLSEEEYSRVKQHFIYGAELLTRIKEIACPVIYAVVEQRERLHKAVSPGQSKEEHIAEYTRIIDITDCYEALIHHRVQGKEVRPYEIIKEMLTSNNLFFDSRILKHFIDLIGIYPIGSYVALNTLEIAKVVMPNDNSPLRPVLYVIIDANKNRLEQPRLINLTKELNIYIKKPLSDEDVLKLIKE